MVGRIATVAMFECVLNYLFYRHACHHHPHHSSLLLLSAAAFFFMTSHFVKVAHSCFLDSMGL